MILVSLPSLDPRDVDEMALFAYDDFRAGCDSLTISQESCIPEPDVLRLIARGREMRIAAQARQEARRG